MCANVCVCMFVCENINLHAKCMCISNVKLYFCIFSCVFCIMLGMGIYKNEGMFKTNFMLSFLLQLCQKR